MRHDVAMRRVEPTVAPEVGRLTGRPNKGMKQTKPEQIGASQLIPVFD